MATKKVLQSTEDIIEAVEKQVGRTFSPEFWDYFEERDYFKEIRKGETLDLLVKDVKALLGQISLLELRLARKTAPPVQHDVNDYRVLLVSHELAKVASAQPYVVRFRRLHLPAGRILTQQEVKAWVEQHTQEPLNSWIVLIVDLDLQSVMRVEDSEIDGTNLQLIRKAMEAEEAGDMDAVSRLVKHDVVADTPIIRLLSWPNTEWVLGTLEDGSAIRDLLQAVEHLYESYGWRKHQAIWFLLTGETPLLPMLQYDISVPQASRDRLRITLDIDIETSPDTVASLYRDLRKQLLHGERRPLQRKMLALALFVDSTPDMEWAERMKQWNKSCRTHGRDEWAYKEHRNMFRDYKTRTIQRLQPEYDFEKLELLIRSS